MGNNKVEENDIGTSRTIIVRLTIPTHKALRIRVAEEDTSIQKWVEALIERELKISKNSAKSGGCSGKILMRAIFPHASSQFRQGRIVS